MESEYPVVVEFGSLVWTGVGYLAHGAMLALQAGLAAYLVATAASAFRQPGRRGFGFLRGVLGILLLLPLIIRAPWLVSLVAMAGSLVLLLGLERGVPPAAGATGRWLGRAAVAAAARRRSDSWRPISSLRIRVERRRRDCPRFATSVPLHSSSAATPDGESRTLRKTFELSGTLARCDVLEPDTLEESRGSQAAASRPCSTPGSRSTSTRWTTPSARSTRRSRRGSI